MKNRKNNSKTERMSKDLFNSSGAEFSECRNFRYKLWRIWDEALPKAMCIGLNPSTANENKNDATITHLTKALKKLGYGGFYMTNLFAFISSNPQDLLTTADLQKDNEIKLAEVRLLCKDVIICWGAFKQATKRIEQVLPRYPDALCFGKNLDGTPEHPMFSLVYKKNKPELKLSPFNH